MKSKTEAIIIGSMNLGEADKLVTFFSLDRGKLRGVADDFIDFLHFLKCCLPAAAVASFTSLSRL